MSKLFDEEGHLSVETILSLKEGKLSDDNLITVLDHIAECGECASVLSDSYDETELVEVPEGFEESIALNIKPKVNSKFSYRLYCVKVISAASIAILILFSNGLNSIAGGSGTDSIKAPDYNKTKTICSQLNSFAEKIINLEVFK